MSKKFQSLYRKDFLALYTCLLLAAAFTLANHSAFAQSTTSQTTNLQATQNNINNLCQNFSGLAECREHLYERTLNDPANLDIALQYASLSVQLKDYEGAISTFERMLILKPDLHQARLEMAILYLRIGAPVVAISHLEEVARRGNRTLSERAESLIQQQKPSNPEWSFHGSASVMAGYDTNPRAAPEVESISLFGIPNVRLPDEAQSIEDYSVESIVTASVNRSPIVKGSGKGIGFEANAFLLSKRQLELTDVNIEYAELRTGPTYNTPNGKGKFKIFGIIGGARLGDSPYLTAYGGGLGLAYIISPSVLMNTSFETQYQDQIQNSDRPSADDNDGYTYRYSLSLNKKFNEFLSAKVSGTFVREDLEVERLSGWSTQLKIGATYQFPSPITALPGVWKISSQAGIEFSERDAPAGAAIDPVNPREDISYTSRLNFDLPVTDTIKLRSEVNWRLTDSKHELFESNNFGARIGLSFSF